MWTVFWIFICFVVAVFGCLFLLVGCVLFQSGTGPTGSGGGLTREVFLCDCADIAW